MRRRWRGASRALVVALHGEMRDRSRATTLQHHKREKFIFACSLLSDNCNYTQFYGTGERRCGGPHYNTYAPHERKEEISMDTEEEERER